jgi:hypothetical protein
MRARAAAARQQLARAPLPAGRPLEPATRATMEARLQHDFSRVRVHHDAAAAREAEARAFTVGGDVVLGADADERSLAHELAHVAQQERPGAASDAEPRARAAAESVMAGKAVSPVELGAAAPGLHAQDEDEEKKPADGQPAEETPKDEPPPPDPDKAEPALSINWDLFSQFAAASNFQIPPPVSSLGLFGGPLQLTPPAPLGSGTSTFTPFQYTPPPPIFPTGGFGGPTTGGLPGGPLPTTAGSTGGTPTGSSSAPSRASVFDSGQFSFGLRLGLPSGDKPKPGDPPSAAQEALKKAEFEYQMFTGKVPSGWEAIDKGQLMGAVWGIFSQRIAPGLAQSITSGLSGKTKTGVAFQTDLTVLGDFSGGGITFSIIAP